MTLQFVGTGRVLQASARYEARRFAPWVALPMALSVSSVVVYPWVFPDAAERAALAASIGANPALGLIFGPARDLSTVDGFNAWRSLALGGFLAALGAIFALVRQSRGMEDSGQAELLASGVMSRASRLASASLFALVGSVLIGVVSGLSTALTGGAVESSLLLAATFTVTGWMFAAVAAVAAQLGSDARMANSIAVGVLGVLFILRGVAYSLDAPMWLVWVNPLGWMTETRPGTDPTWWPLLLGAALAMLVLTAAFVLQARRDFGQGMIAPRAGPARGEVLTTWRLALRLNRGSFVTWLVAFVALGMVFGFFTTSITDILAADPAVQQFLAAGGGSSTTLVSQFVVTILSLLGIIAAVAAIQVVVKIRVEERADRLEPILATATSRVRYLASTVTLALAVSTIHVLVAGTLIAAVAASADIGVGFTDTLLQAVATAPAVWAVVAVSVAVVGAQPELDPAVWFGVLVSFALTLLGPSFRLPDWALAISPFWHVPNVATTDVDWTGLLGVSAVALLLLLVGFAGFRRRDLAR